MPQELCVTQVTLGSNESFEAGLRRFNKRVQQSGILTEARRRKHYEKPSARRKKKQAARARKARRASMKANRSQNSEYAF
jgi:small subunit ribosomal protein S21